MKTCQSILAALSLLALQGLTGCGSSTQSAVSSTPAPNGPSAEEIQRAHDLQVAMDTLTTKRKERDSATTEEAALEQQAVRADAEMGSVAKEADAIDIVRRGWSDDFRANYRDGDPTSIEKMVRESSSYMAELKSLNVSDTPSNYQSAFAKFAGACEDLAVGERVRLKIDYSHLNMTSKITNIPDDDLNSDEKDKLNRVKVGGDMLTLAGL